jgi:hypothetical protein
MLDLNDRGGPPRRRHGDRQKMQFFDPATLTKFIIAYH